MRFSNNGIMWDPLCSTCPLAQRTPLLFKDCPRCKKLLEKEELSRYSEEIKDELVSLMIKFLENHEIFRLLELVVSAVATKEQEGR